MPSAPPLPRAVALALATLVAVPVGAQQRPASEIGPPCDGLVVTRVDIRAGRPPFGGVASRWRVAARAVGLHHATTRDAPIRAYLALAPGQICTEQRRAESERMVREQRYIASATVRSVPDGAGGVAIVVETVDEIPVLVGGQFRGVVPRSLSLGNGNVGGHGLHLQGFLERGFAYRDGLGLRVIDYATFGQPWITTVEAFRHPLGHYANAELARPFFTDLQRTAWRGGYTDEVEYRRVGRPAGDPLALRVALRRWDASAIVRAYGTRTVTLLGLGASGIRLRPDGLGIVVTDSGLLADTGSTLANRYRPFESTRLGALAGLRRIGFRTVRGFDALTARQDVASGVMAGVHVARGLGRAGQDDDVFVSGGMYAGRGNSRVFLATVAQAEARHDRAANQWDGAIGSGRAALYVVPTGGVLLSVEDRYSTGVDSRLPLQLDLGDRRGGILGYRNAALAGARRNAARVEARFSREAMIRNADVGVATFGELGTVWAGDAPYGSSATRATVGVSLLAAYPTGSARLYRADIGFPMRRSGAGAGSIEIRFSSEDRTNSFWREPDDIARARTGPVASTLFVTPTAR